MRSRILSRLGILCWLFLSASSVLPTAQADEEPLPSGAIARLGTYRYWHGGSGVPVAVSPDGKIIASGGDRGRKLPRRKGWWSLNGVTRHICLWDPDTGKKLREIGTPNPPSHLVFSPDGKALAAGCGRTVCLWEVTSGRELKRLSHEKDIRFVRFSADGRTVVTGDRSSVSRWKTATAERVRTWLPWKKRPGRLSNGFESETSEDAALSPDGSVLLWRIQKWQERGPSGASGIGAYLRIVKTETDTVVRDVRECPDYEQEILFAPDSRSFVTGPLNEGMSLWSADGRLLRRFREGSFCPVAFSPDGRTIVTRTWHQEVHFWDVKSGDIRKTFCCPRESLTENIKSAVFTSGGKTLLVGANKRLLLLDARTGRELHAGPGHRGSISNLTFSADGRTLTTFDDTTICRWDTADWRPIGRTEQWRSAVPDEEILAASPDGLRFLSHRRDKLIRLREAGTNAALHTFSVRSMFPAAHFSPDGRMLLLLDSSEEDVRKGRCYDVATGQDKGAISLPARSQPPICSPDGTVLAFRAEDGTIRLMDRTTSAEILQLGEKEKEKEKRNREWHLVFSPQGHYLAEAPAGAYFDEEDHHHVRVWRVRTGEEFHPVFIPLRENECGPVAALAVSPDGRTLATGQYGETVVRLWEIASGQECRQLDGHRDSVRSLAFSADGKTLVSGSQDGTALVWDLRNPSGRRTSELTAEELTSLWSDLAAGARRADEAVRLLAHAPRQSVPFLNERLHPAADVAAEKIPQLLRDLDSEQFEVRKKAFQQLELLGERVETELRKCLRARPSLEVRRRVEEILQHVAERTPPGEILRALRALACLEYIGTNEARGIIASLSRGSPEARLTREAVAALDRLARKPSTEP